MAMSGDILGTAIGTAFYNAIPGNIIQCMKPEDRVTMCNTLIQNSKIIASCVVAHITANAQITVNAGIPVTAGYCTGATTGAGTGTIA